MKTTKKIVALLAAGLTLMVSCVRVDISSGEFAEGKEQRFTFAVNIPDSRGLTRAAWEASDDNLLIDNICVLVFDENGFISRHEAEQTGGVSQFSVDLPMSDKKRVLHFVCNYDKWSEFSDKESKNLNEAMVLANMYVSGQRIAYWQRMELAGITPATNIGIVTMMRNVAKISLINNSRAAAAGDPTVSSFLTDVTYAIGNYYDRGTITNFNTLTGEFDGNGILEAPGATAQPVDEAADFRAAYVGNLSDASGYSLFAYERYNSNPNASDQLYVIIKGTYHTSEADLTGEVRYYKIDIVDQDSEVLRDILRNKHYLLTLNLVVNVGYASFPEAINGLALNNFATSVQQSYNSVSDGVAILNLEYVNRTFVNPNTDPSGYDFAIRYSYIDAYTGATDNTGVNMVWGTESGHEPAISFVEALENNKVPGHPVEEYVDRVKGRLVTSTPASGVVAESWIHINKLNLSRTVMLKLRQPFSFGPLVPITVGSQANLPVTINFDIPAELEDYIPFSVYIYGAKMLAPNVSASPNIYWDEDQGTLRYRYTITATGTQELHFVTSSTVGSGTITLRSELFNDASTTITRN